MKKEKSLIERIIQFLNYLQINDFCKEKRNSEEINTELNLQNQKRHRIDELCKTGDYINYELDGKGIPYITIKGIKFLNNYKKEKNRERTLNLQNYLTAALFTLTFLQATIFIIYYFFDLQTKNPSNSIIFLFVSIIATILFFIIFMYNFLKKDGITIIK
jgi:hypothetical protein